MAEIKKESFGKLSDGREVFLFTLRNTKGTEVKVTSYGARLVSYIVRDKDFKKRDIVLGYDSVEPFLYDHDAADMNSDGQISVSDVTSLVNIILTNEGF